jgi:hypothetical protein
MVRNRKRSVEETEARKQNRIRLNKKVEVCPYCLWTVGIPGGYRWHFNNCLQNPNISEKTLMDRANLREQAIRRNLLNKHFPKKKNNLQSGEGNQKG